jgi:hypothetical protein
MSLNVSDQECNSGKKYGQKGTLCGPNIKTLRHTGKILLYTDKKKTTWWRTSSAQQKRGEDFL